MHIVIQVIFFISVLGGSVWNGPKQQCSSNVLTRVRVWGEQHFPNPDFKMNWTLIRMGKYSRN